MDRPVAKSHLSLVLLIATGVAALAGVAAAGAQAALALGGATVTTTIRNASGAAVTSVPAGTTVHDFVQVSGPLGAPTGTVSVSFFSNGTCTKPALHTWSATLTFSSLDTAAVDVLASAMVPGAPGSVSYQATYNGNGTYAAATGACEPLTVTRATSQITSSMELASGKPVTSVVLGTQVFMHVTVSGSFGTPTGTVQVEMYTGSACTTTATVQFLTLSGGALVSPGFSPRLGQYAFRAVYQGSAVYAPINGPCMPVAWVKATPSVGLNVVGSNGIALQPLIGSPADGFVTVTGAIGTPTGTVTVNVYGSDTCSGLARPWALTLVNGTADTAAAGHTELETAPTIRSWIATYSGDANYLGKNSLCMVVRWKANPTDVTASWVDRFDQEVDFPVWGTLIHLRGRADGAFGAPDGSISSALYSDGTCSAIRTGATYSLSNGAADPASPSFALEPGNYSYEVQYIAGATSSYFGLRGTCVPFKVLKASVDGIVVIVTAEGTGATARVGATFQPRASMFSTGGSVTGTVTISEYLGPDCSSTPVATAAGLPLIQGIADAPSLALTPTAAGEVSYQMVYAATAHFDGDVVCQPFAIVAASATPPPTAEPAPTSSPAPGATAQPGGTRAPGSTSVPGSSVAPGASFAPGETTGPEASAGTPGGSGVPGGAQSLAPGETAGPIAAVGAGATTSGAGQPGDVGGVDGAAPGAFLGLLAVVAVLVLVGAWFALRRRRRAPG